MSTILNFWLNTSPTKSTVWLVDKSGLLKGSVFVNLESTQARDILVDILRNAYTKGVSFELAVDVKDINTAKPTAMNLRVDLDTVLSTMVQTVKAEPKPIDAKVLSKAEALLADLATLPAVERVVVAGSANDDDILAF
jgi:vesicle coat complex subunit